MALPLRLGAGLAILGCGAFALPTSRVSFSEHGVVEGEPRVMHQSSESKMTAMNPDVLSTAIARVMTLDSRPELGAELPTGDMFNRADGNVLVFVDGLEPPGSDVTPYIQERLGQLSGTYTLRMPKDEQWATKMQGLLGTAFDVADAAMSQGDVVCAAVDETVLHETRTCRSAMWSAQRDAALTLSGLPDIIVLETGPEQYVYSPNEDGRSPGRSGRLYLGLKDSTSPEMRFAQENALLHNLPEALSERFPAGRESMPLVIVYLSSLKAMDQADPSHRDIARKDMDRALSRFFEALSSRAGRRWTSQLVVGSNLSERLAHRGRRLQESGDNSTSAGNYTLVEITQYQLNMWTGVFLFMLAFLAIYGMITMDIQPDSLLTAKFITDTSGGGLKTD